MGYEWDLGSWVVESLWFAFLSRMLSVIYVFVAALVCADVGNHHMFITGSANQRQGLRAMSSLTLDITGKQEYKSSLFYQVILTLCRTHQ